VVAAVLVVAAVAGPLFVLAPALVPGVVALLAVPAPLALLGEQAASSDATVSVPSATRAEWVRREICIR
jgi:hypothetical protein